MTASALRRLPTAAALLAALSVAFVALAACSDAPSTASAVDFDRNTVCVLDGMTLADFPGPKAQIHYDQGSPEFFCDTREMFSIALRPEQKRRVTGLFTQDMGKADWTRPQGHWIDARTAFYVVGSRLHGSMGPTVASFASEADAQRFSAGQGGQVLRFEQVTLDMVDLSGGATHDHKM